MTRREWLIAAAGVPAALAQSQPERPAPPAGERPHLDPGVTVLNPRTRIPVALIIDDSTCLVNLNRFSIPQFAEVWGWKRYYQDWRSMPHEIPDNFVRRFAQWCGEHGVKGKYSVVPYPACVGRLDRVLPGWTQKELTDSLELVRKEMMPNWDIHPEMITHTRMIDLRTGHPREEISPDNMENSSWSRGGTVAELADYMTYALRIMRNVDLPCEGITTPGGMATGALPELAKATLQSCRDVFGTEIPHYFKHLTSSGDESVAPRVEWASGLDGPNPECVVNITGCTGDWTGGWDCVPQPAPDKFITPDLERGRVVEVIDRGEPALMFGHWTGFYFNGHEFGFAAFREAVRRLEMKYDNLLWMKLTDVARYWAAKELTQIDVEGGQVKFSAPYACPGFTVQWRAAGQAATISSDGTSAPLREVRDKLRLEAGTWMKDGENVIACFDLPKGRSGLRA